MHEQLMQITFHLPCKTIQINGEDYLQRYYIGEQLGDQYWLHRFLRNDSERHLHSHPWTATSTILCGSYIEQRKSGKMHYKAWRKNNITPETLHRIIAVEPNTWTLMQVRPMRLSEWFFINDDGNKTSVKTSPTDWYTECKTRAGYTPAPSRAITSVIQLLLNRFERQVAA